MRMPFGSLLSPDLLVSEDYLAWSTLLGNGLFVARFQKGLGLSVGLSLVLSLLVIGSGEASLVVSCFILSRRLLCVLQIGFHYIRLFDGSRCRVGPV